MSESGRERGVTECRPAPVSSSGSRLERFGFAARTAREAAMSDGSIDVETGGLTEFAGDVRFYAEEVDPLDVDRTRQSFSAGITFGTRTPARWCWRPRRTTPGRSPTRSPT
ncbi:hypothetical protein GCM10020358_17850 [Amorphoplanes nipponensis]